MFMVTFVGIFVVHTHKDIKSSQCKFKYARMVVS